MKAVEGLNGGFMQQEMLETYNLACTRKGLSFHAQLRCCTR